MTFTKLKTLAKFFFRDPSSPWNDRYPFNPVDNIFVGLAGLAICTALTLLTPIHPFAFCLPAAFVVVGIACTALFTHGAFKESKEKKTSAQRACPVNTDMNHTGLRQAIALADSYNTKNNLVKKTHIAPFHAAIHAALCVVKMA